jgi:hypothetical protein
VPRCTAAANIICTSASFCESTIVTSRHCIADAVQWRQLQTLGYSRTEERIDDNPNAERKNEQSSKQLQTVRQILKRAPSPKAWSYCSGVIRFRRNRGPMFLTPHTMSWGYLGVHTSFFVFRLSTSVLLGFDFLVELKHLWRTFLPHNWWPDV